MTRPTKQFVIMFVVVLAVTIVAFNNNTRPGRSGSMVPTTIVQPRQQPEPKASPLTVSGLDGAPRRVPPSTTTAPWTGRLIVRAAADGHVFVVDDRAGGAINEYSPDGALVEAFTDAPGMPPIQSVTDLAVTGDFVWIVDLVASRVHSQDRKTRRWSTTAHQQEPYRLLPLDPSGSRMAVVKIGMNRIADITDAAGNAIQAFEPLLADQAGPSAALDGFVTLSGDNVIFSGKYLGVLAAFGKGDGRRRWLAELVGDPELPAVVSDGKRTWIEHAALLASQAVGATDSKVIVLSQRIAGVSVRSFIDIYAADDGRYQDSLELPLNDRWNSVAINRDGLYAAGDTGVLVWPAAVVEPSRSPSLLSAGRSFINRLAETGETP
jgi:hypothetical protein